MFIDPAASANNVLKDGPSARPLNKIAFHGERNPKLDCCYTGHVISPGEMRDFWSGGRAGAMCRIRAILNKCVGDSRSRS